MKKILMIALCLVLVPVLFAGKSKAPIAPDHNFTAPNIGSSQYTGSRSTPTLVDVIDLGSISLYCFGLTYDWERDGLWVIPFSYENWVYCIQKTSPCTKIDSFQLVGAPAFHLGIGYAGGDVMYAMGYDGYVYEVDMTTGVVSSYRSIPPWPNYGISCGFNTVDDVIYGADWGFDGCSYAQPSQTGTWNTWALSSACGASGAYGASSPAYLFYCNEDATQAQFFQHSVTAGVPNTTPDSVWDCDPSQSQESTADCTFDGQYVYIIDQGDPDNIFVYDVGISPAPAAFWDFEDGWQGWTHTNGYPFPRGWDVEPSSYKPTWTPPDAGDSTKWIDSDAAGSVLTEDTAWSPAVVPPANMAWLTYGLGYNNLSPTSDSFYVGVMTFTSGAWNPPVELKRYSADYGPAWDSLDVSAYSTADSIRIYFYYSANYDWWVAFDNVGLYPPPMEDVGVTAILEPVGAYSLNDVVTPQSQVRNYGGTDETFPVIFTMTHNAILVYADTVDMTLLSGAVDTAIFASYALDETGTYDIVSYTELVGDQNPANDTAYATATIFQWVEDFEDTNGGFVSEPVTGAWEWGVPTSGPGAAHSGTQLWATILAGSYNNDADWRLTSQDSLVATEDNPLISFYHWVDIENYYDGGNVKYSTDDGTTWLLLYPVGGYDDLAYSGNAGIPAESCFCGHPAVWEAEEFTIPVNAGQTVKLRFHFGSDASVIYPGWYIDDLAGLGLTYVGISEEPGNVHIGVFGFAPNMSTVTKQPIINYSTTTQGRECLKVYDNTGRLIRTLVDRPNEAAGTKSVYWNRKDDTGRTVANGVYFIRLESVNQYATHKLVLVK